jgi:hypothetical protein
VSARDRIILPKPKVAASMADMIAISKITLIYPAAITNPWAFKAATRGLISLFKLLVGISGSKDAITTVYKPTKTNTV